VKPHRASFSDEKNLTEMFQIEKSLLPRTEKATGNEPMKREWLLDEK
jgi:hypothetical protein